MNQQKLAAMQIEDDDADEEVDDDERFQRLFGQGRSEKENETPALFSVRMIEDLSDVFVSDRVQADR